nr:MAG TPA: hypothetical protein [Caudoviricetes sp.]
MVKRYIMTSTLNNLVEFFISLTMEIKLSIVFISDILLSYISEPNSS